MIHILFPARIFSTWFSSKFGLSIPDKKAELYSGINFVIDSVR